MASGDMRAARRYARALFRTALGHGEVDEVAQSLGIVTTAAAQSPELMAVLHHPRITRQRKQELLQQVFEGRVRPDVEHFLFMLVEKDRAVIIPNVAEQFLRMLDEYRREMDAEALTAIPLSQAQKDALRRQLEAATGYTVRLTTRIDESILGGLVVRVGDRMFDGSVTTQLQTIREQLKQVKVT
jgi:F-type H+-transporting ATPase subunit delta